MISAETVRFERSPTPKREKKLIRSMVINRGHLSPCFSLACGCLSADTFISKVTSVTTNFAVPFLSAAEFDPLADRLISLALQLRVFCLPFPLPFIQQNGFSTHLFSWLFPFANVSFTIHSSTFCLTFRLVSLPPPLHFPCFSYIYLSFLGLISYFIYPYILSLSLPLSLAPSLSLLHCLSPPCFTFPPLPQIGRPT